MTLYGKACRRTYLGEVVDPTVDVEVFLFVSRMSRADAELHRQTLAARAGQSAQAPAPRAEEAAAAAAAAQ